MTGRKARPKPPAARSRLHPRPARPARPAKPATRIHKTAVVARGAELDRDVEIGPLSVVGPHVRIGKGTIIGPHAVIEGRTTIGEGNRIFQFAALGAVPQDLKYRGEDSELVIGDRNQIREFATLHLGTEPGGMITRVGNDNLLMAYTHVAHDCHVGNRIIMANGAQLGGHVVVEDFALIGALVGVLQFARLGESAMIGAGSMVSLDVAPFCNATGDRATLHGLNLLGLRRRGFSDEVVQALKQAYRLIFREQLKLADAITQVRAAGAVSPEVERLLTFIERSERGLCR